jgi:hypothetical protein
VLALAPARGGDPGAPDVRGAVEAAALAARAAPVVAAILLGLVAAVLARGDADAGRAAAAVQHGERLLEVGEGARVRAPAGRWRRLLPELDGAAGRRPGRLGRVVVERVGGPRGEQREAGIGVVVEGRRRGGDDHHPDVGRAVVQLAHGGSRGAPEGRAQRGAGGGRGSCAFIEAEGEVVAAGGGGGDPVREGAGVRWEAPSGRHTYSPGGNSLEEEEIPFKIVVSTPRALLPSLSIEPTPDFSLQQQQQQHKKAGRRGDERRIKISDLSR